MNKKIIVEYFHLTLNFNFSKQWLILSKLMIDDMLSFKIVARHNMAMSSYPLCIA